MLKKLHYVYQITNTLNSEIYIGVHSTYNLGDGYMGSGTKLRELQEQYGINNFIKEIIKFFDTRKQAMDFERELVSEEFVNRSDTMNISVGGAFGCIEFANKRRRELLECHGGLWYEASRFAGFKHHYNSKRKTAKTMKGYGTGIENTQYGTHWITNGLVNQKIKHEDLEQIPAGWRLGRVIKQKG